MFHPTAAVVAAALLLSACGGPTQTPADPAGIDDTSTAPSPVTDAGSPDAATTESVTFLAEVWADNWFSLYVDGELVGEDSVPITTERSFNAETITFEATYPFTVAMVTKDFKEDDSGLEYIGTSRQQMGDGGLIVQITDTATGEVVATTSSEWKALVVHRAPLDKACESSSTPDTDCGYEVVDEPTSWQDPGFEDSAWVNGTEYSAAAVDPKGGYDEIAWDAGARLLWTEDLETDNTILWRFEVLASG